MEIKHAIESIQHNFLLNTHEKMGLMGLFQELEEYRKNPLAKMQSCKKWVKRNDINQQLDHIKSEISEFEKAETFEESILEWWDILQSALTGMIILKIKYGVDLDKLLTDGIKKNTDRAGGSYYE